MSILAGKNILVIGEVNHQIAELEAVLSNQHMVIFTATCGETNVQDILSKKIDIILLTHVHEGSACKKILSQLQNENLTRVIPIFALVEPSEDKIQHALMLGAADYITTLEPVVSIIQKMKLIFGEPDNFSDSASIDITPDNFKSRNAGIKVYIVEDDSLLRNLLTMRLEQSSYIHEFSKDGIDVINKMRLFKPQVIILDIMLPIKNGFEILAELKADSELKSVPVIMFSNRDEQNDKKKSFELGADRYYVKAMTDLSVVVETIAELAT